MRTIGYGLVGAAVGLAIGGTVGAYAGSGIALIIIAVCTGVGVIFGLFLDIDMAKANKLGMIKKEKDAIEEAFTTCFRQAVGSRNFGAVLSKFTNVKPENKAYLDNRIMKVRDDVYSNAVSEMRAHDSDPSYAFRVVADLLTIPAFKEEANANLDKQRFFYHNNERVMSVLTNAEDISEIVSRYKSNMGYYVNAYNTISQYISKGKSAGNPSEAFSYLAFAKAPASLIEDFRNLPIAIALQEPHNAEAFDFTQKIYMKYFAHWYKSDRGQILRIPTTDYLVAHAFNYHRGGLIDNINKELEFWLSFYTGAEFISQYNVLIKVFAYLKAPRQEEMVLDAIFTNKLPRTEQMETRLRFLKNKMDDAPEVLSHSSGDNVFAFDYRSVKWKPNEVKQYVETATMSQKLLKLPMVTEEWEQDITVSDFVWDVDKAMSMLQSTLDKEYGEGLVCSVVKAGALTDSGIETVPSILISAAGGNFALNYPWISILIIGDQLTKSRINLSIYSLMLPEQVTSDEQSLPSKNNAVCSKLLVMKEGQNPKLNRLITSVRYTITKTLEDLLKEPSADNFF